LKGEGHQDAIQNVQVILYDPDLYPTPTGDGEIVFQYDTVDNSDWRDGRATVGVQNRDRTDGVLYTYADAYAPGAATLQSGRAIRFVPLGLGLPLGVLEGDARNASNGDSPIEGVRVRVVGADETLISGSDGRYAGDVQEGNYTIVAQHESFYPAQVNGVEIIEDETTVLDFELTDILGPYIENTTVLSHTDDTIGPYIIDTFIIDYSDIAETHFYYELGGAGQHDEPLTLIDPETGQYQAEIPGQPLNTRISYWLEAVDVVGNVSRDPETPGSYYEFFVVPAFNAIDDDFEQDLGWTVGDTGDDATEGIWERVDPIGVWEGDVPVQPEDDASPDGTLCFITGNNESGQQGDDDVDGGKTTLLSPWFDLSNALTASVSYRRWYTNDTGGYWPYLDIWEVQVTGDGSNWMSLELTDESERSWTSYSFNLSDFIELTGTVRFRFIAWEDDIPSIVEAGLDEFMITGFLQPGPTVADGNVPGQVTLLQCAPNPFNPVTRIRFGLPEDTEVSLRVFDAGGRLVRTLLADEPLVAGYHDVVWDGRDDLGRPASSGVYLYRVSTDMEQLSAKAILLK